jgi:hypothetical protein
VETVCKCRALNKISNQDDLHVSNSDLACKNNPTKTAQIVASFKQKCTNRGFKYQIKGKETM